MPCKLIVLSCCLPFSPKCFSPLLSSGGENSRGLETAIHATRHCIYQNAADSSLALLKIDMFQ